MKKEMLKIRFYAAVKEVNIATASHSTPLYSHEEILECRGITELRRLGKLLKVKYYGKLSKQELIPKIVEAINRPAMLRILLNQLIHAYGVIMDTLRMNSSSYSASQKSFPFRPTKWQQL